nr:uncharacterized protein LOC104108014 [Nicotiana tomentosiformis]
MHTTLLLYVVPGLPFEHPIKDFLKRLFKFALNLSNRFYSIANRVLTKPGGIIAVWGYTTMSVSSEFDQKMKSFLDSTLAYWHPNAKFLFDRYRTLPFPFESVVLGSEGNPIPVDMQKEMSFEGFFAWLKSWSAINTAKEKGWICYQKSWLKNLR